MKISSSFSPIYVSPPIHNTVVWFCMMKQETGNRKQEIGNIDDYYVNSHFLPVVEM